MSIDACIPQILSVECWTKRGFVLGVIEVPDYGKFFLSMLSKNAEEEPSSCKSLV